MTSFPSSSFSFSLPHLYSGSNAPLYKFFISVCFALSSFSMSTVDIVTHCWRVRGSSALPLFGLASTPTASSPEGPTADFRFVALFFAQGRLNINLRRRLRSWSTVNAHLLNLVPLLLNMLRSPLRSALWEIQQSLLGLGLSTCSF